MPYIFLSKAPVRTSLTINLNCVSTNKPNKLAKPERYGFYKHLAIKLAGSLMCIHSIMSFYTLHHVLFSERSRGSKRSASFRA